MTPVHYRIYGLFLLDGHDLAVFPLTEFDTHNDARNFLDEIHGNTVEQRGTGGADGRPVRPLRIVFRFGVGAVKDADSTVPMKNPPHPGLGASKNPQVAGCAGLRPASFPAAFRLPSPWPSPPTRRGGLAGRGAAGEGEAEAGAFGAGGDQHDLAAVHAHVLARDGEAEAGAARAR